MTTEKRRMSTVGLSTIIRYKRKNQSLHEKSNDDNIVTHRIKQLRCVNESHHSVHLRVRLWQPKRVDRMPPKKEGRSLKLQLNTIEITLVSGSAGEIPRSLRSPQGVGRIICKLRVHGLARAFMYSPGGFSLLAQVLSRSLLTACSQTEPG